MSRLISNTDIVTDNWETALIQLNRASWTLSYEAITANSSVANTGNNTVSRIGQLWGTFGSNTIVVTNELKGGNVNGLSANLVISSNVVMGGNTTSFVYNFNCSNTFVASGNSSFAGPIVANSTFATNGAATFGNTLSVTGSSTLGGAITQQTEYYTEVVSNTNIGSNTTSPQKIYSFPKATYTTGKLLAQIRNTGNTQISEMVLAHDSSIAYMTTYGTVSSPASSNTNDSLLGTFTANVNGANVDILITQSIANSAVKIVSNLIKA